MKIAESAFAVIGADNLYRLAEAYGGTRIKVPADFDAANALRSQIGDDLAALVVFHFGGTVIYVPTMKPPAVPTSLHQAEIEKLDQAGLSAREIARRCGCSQRSIYAHRKRKRTKGLIK